jgi:hypothetical protein
MDTNERAGDCLALAPGFNSQTTMAETSGNKKSADS